MCSIMYWAANKLGVGRLQFFKNLLQARDGAGKAVVRKGVVTGGEGDDEGDTKVYVTRQNIINFLNSNYADDMRT